MDFSRAQRRDLPALFPIQKAPAQNIPPEPAKRGMKHRRCGTCFPAGIILSFRPEACVNLAPVPVILGAGKGVMIDIAVEHVNLSLDGKAFVNFSTFKPPVLALKQADQSVRVPIAVPDPTFLIPYAPGHAVSGNVSRRARLDHALDLLAQIGGEFFIGIEAQHPIVFCQAEHMILLANVTQPLLLMPTRGETLGDRFCAVRAARVHNDNFVHEIHAAFEAA